MSSTILLELEQNRARLAFYYRQKDALETQKAAQPAPPAGKSTSGRKAAAPPQPAAIDKWIEIYRERVRKLENKAIRTGLVTKVQLKEQQKKGHAHA